MEKFNNDFEDEDLKINPEILDSDVINDAIAKDGNLPGGLSPEMMKALASDAEIMNMLKDPKVNRFLKNGLQIFYYDLRAPYN